MGLPNLDKLAEKCQKLGLAVVQKGKRPAKSDYVDVLRAHFLPPGGLKFTEVEPMLCFASWNLKPDEEAKIWTSPSWAAQIKFNGCRLMLHFVAGVGVFAHSRTVSVKTYRFEELTDQLLWSDYVPDFTATMDCEVMIEKAVDTTPYTAKGVKTKSSLHSTTAVLSLAPESSKRLQLEQDAPLNVHVFDVLNLDGTDLRGKRLAEREVFRKKMAERIAGIERLASVFHFPPLVTEGKRGFVDQILANGGEGAILKNLNAIYEDSSSRSRNGWVKVKKRIEFDAFVTGFVRGEPGSGWENLVGALTFSVHTEKGIHELGNASNLTLETRKKISVFDPTTNTVSLVPQMLGKVAEISGQDISSRSLRLSHCTIDRWRKKDGPDGKTADQCVQSYADLVSAAEWVG
jgi:ATP-dependent DNA ligase